MSKAKGKVQLTDRQKKAIPFLVSSATYTEGCKKAKINKTTLDEWLTIAQDDSQQIIDTWSGLSSQLGHRVTVEYNQQPFTGNCIGVDPAEGLILQLDDGGVQMFDAAHTTIVKHL